MNTVLIYLGLRKTPGSRELLGQTPPWAAAVALAAGCVVTGVIWHLL